MDAPDLHDACESQLVDLALDATPPAEMAFHLENCARCRAALQSHRAIWSAVASLPKRPPSSGRRDNVLAAAALSLKGAVLPPRPGASKFGEIDDAPIAGARSLDNTLAPARPTRDVKAHVLHAAAAAAAGIAPPSVERFKDVPSASSLPVTSGAKPEPRRHGGKVLALAAVVLVAIVAAHWSPVFVEAPASEGEPSSLDASVPVLRKVTQLAPVETPPVAPSASPRPAPVTPQAAPAADSPPFERSPDSPESRKNDIVASRDEVRSLCARIGEGDWLARKNTVSALGELGTPAALECLRASRDPDWQIQFWIDQWIVQLRPALEALPSEFVDFAELDPIKEGESFSSQQVQLAVELVRDSLARHRVGLRVGRGRADADGGDQHARYRLRLTVTRDRGRMRAELVVLRNESLVGSWNAKASGATVDWELRATVPRLIDDAFGDLGWSPQRYQEQGD